MVRVFVSSTWIDLEPERLAVEHALHRMRGAEHLGMEYFGSRPETPHDASLAEVDRSDVYIGIFGYRYGSGITEAEYRRARERGLPCFIYLKEEPADIPAALRDVDPVGAASLAALKAELRREHITSVFSSPGDLAGKVATDLHNHLMEWWPQPAVAPARRHNLPAAVDRFVGREREVARVRALVHEHRLVTLTGTGGAGKTRLALEAAHGMMELYPDGIWLVELASLQEPSLLPQTVAATLGLRESPGTSFADLLTEHLRPKTLLLLLDNCEHLVAVCRVMVDRLLRECAGMRVLATSRAQLDAPGEVVWRVPSLRVPLPPPPPATPEGLSEFEAVVLFLERGRAKRPELTLTSANAPSISEICRRLDGIPLAIELAAARVKALAPEQIAARLADRFKLLQGGSAISERQRTLRAALDWSHDLLTESERVLFRRLSVFVGGCSLEAAEEVCADAVLPDANILDLITELVEQSLVIADEDNSVVRFRLLETVRAYAMEQLESTDEAAAVRERELEWAAAMVAESAADLTGPDQAESLARLAAEHDNLRAALAWAMASGNATQALRLGAALRSFWVVRGFLTEGRDWLERALRLPDGPAPGRLQADARDGAGDLAHRQGDYETARRHFEESRALRRTMGDQAGLAASLLGLSAIESIRGDVGAAIALVDEALVISSDVGDQRGVATALYRRAYIAYQQMDYPTARAALEQALAIERRHGHRRGAAIVLDLLGNVARREGRFVDAHAHYDEALITAQMLGDRWGSAATLDNLGNLAFVEGDIARARELGEQALAISRDIGDRYGIARALSSLGLVEERLGQPDEARSHHEASLMIRHQLNHRWGVAASLESIGISRCADGRSAEAVRLLAAAHVVRAAVGAPLPPDERRRRQAAVEALRHALGAEAFEAAWEAGQELSLDEAVALALRQEPEP